MANRTIRMIGQAYAESGDVSVVMTVGGTEVYNGTVSDSTTVRSGQPTTENTLWTWELDENTTGDLAVSITVSGGELCLGPAQYNGVRKRSAECETWVTNNHLNLWNSDQTAIELTADEQTAIAGYGTEARLGTDLYNALVAGTKTNPTADEQTTMHEAMAPRDFTTYHMADDTRSSAQLNGADLGWSTDADKIQNWVIAEAGDVITYTWNFTPDTSYEAV